MKIYQANHLETIVDDFSYSGIVLQFLTPKDFYRTRIKEDMAKWSIYETEIAIEDWVSNQQSFYANPALEINVPFLNCLPINLRGEEISYLFFFLGKNCLLSLQDMLNIDQVLISFPLLCRLQRC